MQELQQLVQSLTRKVGESEERFSLLQEQAESLKELLVTEKEQYSQKETMYKQNVGFKALSQLLSVWSSSIASVVEFDPVFLCWL